MRDQPTRKSGLDMYELVRFIRDTSSRSPMCRIRAVFTAIIGVAATTAAWAQQPPSPAPSPLAVIQRTCVGCHDIGIAAGKGRSAQEWSDVIDRMVDHGLDVSDAELAAVKAYLAKALPPGVEGPPKELRP